MSKVLNTQNSKPLTRSEQEKRSMFMSLGFSVVVVMAIVFTYQIATASARNKFNHLEERASRIYAIDRAYRDCEHGKCLPAGRVRALSVMLAFRDQAGAENVLNELETVAAKLTGQE